MEVQLFVVDIWKCIENHKVIAGQRLTEEVFIKKKGLFMSKLGAVQHL